MSLVRTVDPLTEKILQLPSYVEPHQLNSDISYHLLNNIKNTYEGKKSVHEGLIVKIIGIEEESDIKISNSELGGICESKVNVRCIVCLVSPKTLIVCKVLQPSNLYYISEAAGGKIVVIVFVSEDKKSLSKSLNKDSFIVVNIDGFLPKGNTIVARSYFEDFATDDEIKQYYNNEHRIALSSKEDVDTYKKHSKNKNVTDSKEQQKKYSQRQEK